MSDGDGAQSMTAPLRRVVVRRSGVEIAAADPGEWHDAAAVDLEHARPAHDAAHADGLPGDALPAGRGGRAKAEGGAMNDDRREANGT